MKNWTWVLARMEFYPWDCLCRFDGASVGASFVVHCGNANNGTLIDTTGRKFEQEIAEITETDNGNSVPSVYSCSIVFPSYPAIDKFVVPYIGSQSGGAPDPAAKPDSRAM